MEYKINHCYKFTYNNTHTNQLLEELVIYLGPSYFDWQQCKSVIAEELEECKPKGHAYYSITHDKLVTASASVSMLPIGDCVELPIDQITDQFIVAKIYNYLNVPFTVTRIN